MATISCDICGGTLSMDASGDFAVCDSCGMKHTKDRVKAMAQEVTGTVAVSNIASIESLMKRGLLDLEDSKFGHNYFDKILDINPDYAPAYIGKLCADLRVKNESLLVNQTEPFDNNPNYIKAMRFADENCRIRLKKYDESVKQQIENKKQRIINNNERFSKFSKYIESTLRRHPIDLLDNGTVNVSGEYDYSERFNEYGETIFVSNKQFSFDLKNIIQVASGNCHVVLLKSNGDVVSQGDNYKLEYVSTNTSMNSGNTYTKYRKVGTYSGAITSASWGNIIAIAAGSYHTVGLKADGTVVATGLNDNGQCNTGNWNNIIAIYAGDKFTIGAKADGTFLTTGEGFNGVLSEEQITNKFKQQEQEKQQREEAERVKRERRAEQERIEREQRPERERLEREHREEQERTEAKEAAKKSAKEIFGLILQICIMIAFFFVLPMLRTITTLPQILISVGIPLAFGFISLLFRRYSCPKLSWGVVLLILIGIVTSVAVGVWQGGSQAGSIISALFIAIPTSLFIFKMDWGYMGWGARIGSFIGLIIGAFILSMIVGGISDNYTMLTFLLFAVPAIPGIILIVIAEQPDHPS